MALPTRPFLVVYVVRHPGFAAGQMMAEELYDHFRRKLFENVAGGTGLSVIYRSVPPPGAAAPLPLDFDEGETAAVVALIDEAFAASESWPISSITDSTFYIMKTSSSTTRITTISLAIGVKSA